MIIVFSQNLATRSTTLTLTGPRCTAALQQGHHQIAMAEGGH